MPDFSIALAFYNVNTGCQCHALCNGVGLGRVQPFIETQFTYIFKLNQAIAIKNTNS